MTKIKMTENEFATEVLTGIRNRAAELEARAAELAAAAYAQRIEAERVLKLARGTRDVTAQAEAAKRLVAAPSNKLANKVEAFLRARGDATFEQIVKDVDEPAGRVSTAMTKLRKAGAVYNVATDDRPRWLWVIGDNTEPAELRETIIRLIKKRAWTFADLLAATGARRGRVSGVIVDLQRTGAKIVNEGSERYARWRLK